MELPEDVEEVLEVVVEVGVAPEALEMPEMMEVAIEPSEAMEPKDPMLKGLFSRWSSSYVILGSA